MAADLILSGYRAYLSDQGLPYDVVLDINGQLLRVQVKSTRGHRAVPQRQTRTPGYLFWTRRAGKGGKRQHKDNAFDLVAMVALDIRVVAYMPLERMPGTVVLRPPGANRNPTARRMENIDEFPIGRALDLLRERRGGNLILW